MLASCSLLTTLFVLTIACVIAGHVAGVLAWRRRLPQYSRWRWLSDPTYVFRSSYYRDPKPRGRLVAATLLTLGAALIIALAVVIVVARKVGETGICGLSF